MRNRRSVLKETLLRLHNEWGGRCCYCNHPVYLTVSENAANRATLDHFIPKSRRGSSIMNNLIVACRKCNSHKSNKDPYEWYRKHRNFSETNWVRILNSLGLTELKLSKLCAQCK